MKLNYKICIVVPVLGYQNSILFVFSELKKLGCNVVVITSTSGGFKQKSKNISFETIDGIDIHRVADDTSSKAFLTEIIKIKSILDSFKPNIVLFGTWNLFRIASKLSKTYNSKLIWLTEFYFNNKRFIGGRKYYLGLKILLNPLAYIMRFFLTKNVDKIILSDISEKNLILEKNKKLTSIGWCNNLPNKFDVDPCGLNEKLNQGIFAGSFTSITINEKFVKAISFLLNNKLLDKIVIVGDGPKKYIIENLIEKFGKDKIEYLGQIERLEVLDLIKKSKIALNTTHEGGWGFIGECFAVGTLLLYTRNHYLFNHNYDSFHLNFTLSDRDDLNDILSNEELYHKLQENMICRYNNEHSAKSIGSKYFDLIKTTLLENE